MDVDRRGTIVVSIGDVFGDWTVSGAVYNIGSPSRRMVPVVCVCGNTASVSPSNLRRGYSKRCRPCSATIGGNTARQDAKTFTVNRAFEDYKKTARRRGIDFELTKEQFSELIFQNCTYCSAVPKNKIHDRLVNRTEVRYNGIDRVDNSRGYCSENVVTCCRKCNESKRAMTIEEFKSWIEGLVSQYGKW